jgi:hypothetical protein
MGVIDWRQQAPRASFRDHIAGFRDHIAGFQERRVDFRERIAGWRARNWRRAVLTWSVLCLICVAISAEPGTAFPLAQAHSVAALGIVMRIAGGLTVAGIPALLIVLP